MGHGTFQVCQTTCPDCLFSQQRIVSLSRKREILRECKATDTHFVCHHFEAACCRGFYDRFSTNLIRIAQRLGVVEFVPLDAPDGRRKRF